jgi:hypothetical protein
MQVFSANLMIGKWMPLGIKTRAPEYQHTAKCVLDSIRPYWDSPALARDLSA